MREKILALLRRIDDDIVKGTIFNGSPVSIYLIGGAAIALGIDAAATTKDIDLAEPADSKLNVLAERYGQRTSTPHQFGVYLEVVNDSQALLPPTERYRRSAVELSQFVGQRLRVFRLDDGDLIISKIKRFKPRDRDDIMKIINHSSAKIDASDLRKRLDALSMYVADTIEMLEGNLERVINYLEGSTDTI